LAGALVTKVIYLEHPCGARPEATLPDRPIELTLRPGTDPWEEARQSGRPLMIVRIGGRQVRGEELLAGAVARPVLLPGDKSLGPPACPPFVPWACWPVYDPIGGPRPPEEECLHDGGDAGQRAGLDNQGRLHGLDAADTLAVSIDTHGARHVAVSNRVCICVPRVAILTASRVLNGYNATLTLERATGIAGQEMVRVRQPALLVRQVAELASVNGRQRPSATENIVGLVATDQFTALATVE